MQSPWSCLGLARPSSALLGLQAAFADQGYMGVIVVVEGMDAEAPVHAGTNVLPHDAGRAR